MRTGLRRVAVPAPARPTVQSRTIPAPTAGWVTNQTLSNTKPGSALVLDNYIPTQTGVKFRGGSDEYFDGEDGNPITSLFTYKVSGNSVLFAADAETIWNISGSPAAAVTEQSGGYYSTTQFETPDDTYLFAPNGVDAMQRYDGTSWLAITDSSDDAITGIDTSTFSHVWVWKSRLFFVQFGTMTAWYLGPAAIAGAASDHTLAGVFQRGGSLLFGGTWSIDAGDGADDKCVFISTEGEVAIYEGTDPSDPDKFSMVGRYELGGKPLGKNAWMRAGGDLIIATVDGLVPLSQVFQKDPAALSLASVSRNIEPDWKREAVLRQTVPWTITKWDEQNLAFVAMPVIDETTPARSFIVNTETGAWARFTGWDTRSSVVHDGQLYFGTSDGRVMLGNVGGNDDDELYVCALALSFDHLKQPGRLKILKQARATFRSSRAFRPKLSASVDYAQRFPAPPSSPASVTEDVWDAGLWDTAVWDSASSETIVNTRWKSITGAGFAHAFQLQAAFGVPLAPEAELMTIDVTYEVGALVV